MKRLFLALVLGALPASVVPLTVSAGHRDAYRRAPSGGGYRYGGSGYTDSAAGSIRYEYSLRYRYDDCHGGYYGGGGYRGGGYSCRSDSGGYSYYGGGYDGSGGGYYR